MKIHICSFLFLISGILIQSCDKDTDHVLGTLPAYLGGRWSAYHEPSDTDGFLGPDYLTIHQQGNNFTAYFDNGDLYLEGDISRDKVTITVKGIGNPDAQGYMEARIFSDSVAGTYEFPEESGAWYMVRGENEIALGSIYTVWGGYDYICDTLAYSPQYHGYHRLGIDSVTQSFWCSNCPYVIIHTDYNCIARVDAVEGNNGLYYSSYCTGNTIEPGNIGGPPDGYYATVGGQFNGSSRGYALIDTSQDSLFLITVYIADIKSSMFSAGLKKNNCIKKH
jgi:hypothetical protein